MERARLKLKACNNMCLFPRFIKNKRYMGYKHKKPKDGAPTATECTDPRKLYVAIGCGKCFECKRQKAQQWRVRLLEELKVQKFAYFVTLTFSNESLNKLMKKYDKPECNGLAAQAVRLFLERYRKKYKHSIKHWLITELGHENTERIHLHGLLFPDHPITPPELTNLWSYGMIYIGEFCNEQTINYVIKYVLKIDTDHKTYEPLIMCSAGIGKNFTEKFSTKLLYQYRPKNAPEYYLLKNGNKVALPIYYRNKLYDQNERDLLWTERLDAHKIYVNGIACNNIDTADGYAHYMSILREAQLWNNSIGYGDLSDEWKTEDYNITFRMLNKKED